MKNKNRSIVKKLIAQILVFISISLGSTLSFSQYLWKNPVDDTVFSAPPTIEGAEAACEAFFDIYVSFYGPPRNGLDPGHCYPGNYFIRISGLNPPYDLGGACWLVTPEQRGCNKGWPIYADWVEDCSYSQEFNNDAQRCKATAKTPVNKSAGKRACMVGNPVNIATGNKFQAEVDFNGAGDLKIVRYFNSEALYDLGFGVGWTSPIKRKLTQDGDRIIVLRDDGYTEGLQKVDGVWTADPDSKITLTEDINGFILTEGDGVFESYDISGKLISETNLQGQTTSYNYNSENQLTTIVDQFGRQLTFTYNAAGQIESITIPGNKTIAYSYDTNDRLTSFTNQNNTTRYYRYENSAFPHALTGITDENGNRYATWTYDAQGRAISSEHANGVDKTTLTYNADDTTTVTNPLGKQTTYHFTTIQGVRKVTQVEGHPTTTCEGANKSYSYDANGNIISKTDWNGVTTTYTYDMERNLELSRTEAVGTPQERTITTDWHADYRLPVKITEPNRITEYSYDTQGRQLSHKELSVQ